VGEKWKALGGKKAEGKGNRRNYSPRREGGVAGKEKLQDKKSLRFKAPGGKGMEWARGKGSPNNDVQGKREQRGEIKSELEQLDAPPQ